MELLEGYMKAHKMTNPAYVRLPYVHKKADQELRITWRVSYDPPDRDQIAGLNNLILTYIQHRELIEQQKEMLKNGIPIFA